jgi:hypothetical protein
LKEPQKVTKKPDPEDYSEIAKSIGRISDAAKALRASGLSRDAVVVLIKHATGVPMKTITKVLSAAEDLKSWCLSK